MLIKKLDSDADKQASGADKSDSGIASSAGKRDSGTERRLLN